MIFQTFATTFYHCFSVSFLPVLYTVVNYPNTWFTRSCLACSAHKSNKIYNKIQCGMKCCYFWFNSEIKFLTRFDVFFDLVILLYFNANSIDFYVVKCLIYTYFCNFLVCKEQNRESTEVKSRVKTWQV